MMKFGSAAPLKLLLLLVMTSCSARADHVDNREIGHIFDITHAYTPELPRFGSSDGIGIVVPRYKGINSTENRYLNWAPVSLAINAGTHTKARTAVEKLDLEILNGPALVLQVPEDKNLTAAVLEFLSIPDEIERVLFKTSNSAKGLMYKKEFDSSYSGLTTDGAEWLTINSNIKLIGIDYLSVAVMQGIAPVYKLLGEDIISVEGLKLDEISPGEYSLSCLPLGVSQVFEAPTRCILIQ